MAGPDDSPGAGVAYPWNIDPSPDMPVIGVCSAMEPARWSVWDLPAALVPMNYIEHIQRAGGVAVLIPPDPALVADPGRVLDRIDGLILVGGADIAADVYGAEPHPTADPPIPLRDATEIALVRAAASRGLPVLGICRGAQVINVAAGGTLRQHLPEDVGHEEHRRAIGRFAGNEHDVVVEAGSRARAADRREPAPGGLPPPSGDRPPGRGPRDHGPLGGRPASRPSSRPAPAGFWACSGTPRPTPTAG